MPSLDERVAYLEGRLEEHASTVMFLRADVRAVHEDLSAFRAEFRQELKATSAGLNTKIDAVERRLDRVDGRLDRVDDKLTRHFTWLVGIQVAALIAVLGALLGR